MHLTDPSRDSRTPSLILAGLLAAGNSCFLLQPGWAEPESDPQSAEAKKTPAQTQPAQEQTNVPVPSIKQPGAGRSLGYPGLPGQLSDSNFAIVPDRWRLELPTWWRWEFGQRNLLDPYHQNVLKGDFPIYGDSTFFVFTGVSDTVTTRRQRPVNTAGTVINEFIINQNFFTSFEIFHGKTVFKPKDWSFKFTPAFNLNFQEQNEDNQLEEDVALQEAFAEVKLADLNDYYDSVSARVGRQVFVSDFRGFVFNDVNQGATLFGACESNRYQWNFAVFQQQNKDPVSNFNEFESRNQFVTMANLIAQDFLWPGFFGEISFHYNRDRQGGGTDLDAYYIGLAGNGHIGRLNVVPAFYYAFGDQENNFLAGRDVDISAYFLALELTYPHDWLNFRVSGAFASGDSDADDGDATGFDGIFDNPNFVGNGFSYWVREPIAINGKQLVNANSFYPNLRGKAAAASNFVNPGIYVLNVGVDAKVTAKTILTTNLNYFSFVEIDPLEKNFGVADIDKSIGLEYGAAFQYRPFLNENVIITLALSVLHPGSGLEDLTGNDDPVYTAFLALTLVY